MKQKTSFITILSLAFVFTASAAFASLNFGSDSITSDSSLELEGDDIRIKGTIVAGPDYTDASGYAFPGDWVTPGFGYGSIISSPATEASSYGQEIVLSILPDSQTQLGYGQEVNIYSSEDATQEIDGLIGLIARVDHSGSGEITSDLTGIYAVVYNYNSISPSADIFGAFLSNSNIGTIDNMYGLYSMGTNNGIANNVYGGYLKATTTGTTTNAYSLFVDQATGATNNYNIYSGSAPTSDYWSGETGNTSHYLYAGNNKDYTLVALNESSSTSQDYQTGIYAGTVSTSLSGTRSTVTGLYAEAVIEGGANIDSVDSLSAYAEHAGSGTVMNMTGIKIWNNTANSTVTNNIGLWVKDQIGAVNNYAIKTGAGLVELGDTLKQKNGGNVASATTTTLPGGNGFHITGTTNITTLNTCNAANSGRFVTLVFDGVLTFTDGNNLKLSGNFVTTADDSISLFCDGTNWFETFRSVN